MTTARTIEIRPAVRADTDALCDAHVAAWRVAYRGLFPDALLDSEEFEAGRRAIWRAARWFGDPDQQVFAAVLAGVVSGFAHVGAEREHNVLNGSGRGEVYGFYNQPSTWGSGLARASMAAAEQWLGEHGFTEATLWVLRDNPRARSFYEKSGWAWTGKESLWSGPNVAGQPAPDPIAEVQYARTL